MLIIALKLQATKRPRYEANRIPNPTLNIADGDAEVLYDANPPPVDPSRPGTLPKLSGRGVRETPVQFMD
jgi:hypothetical protein